MSFLSLGLLSAALLFSGFWARVALAQGGVPAEALNLVQHVHETAKRKDFSALRNYMSDDSNGVLVETRSREQALYQWRKDPSYLRNLQKVTAQGCGFVTPQIV